MATTSILAPSDTTSAEFTSDIQAPTTLTLRGFSADVRVQIEKKDSDGAWRSVGQLISSASIYNLVANGTWRVRRTAGAGGVDRS